MEEDDVMDISSATSPAEGGGDQPDARGKPASAAPLATGAGLPTMKKSDFLSDTYNMNHRNRGLAVIFNNKTFDTSTGMGQRTGTDVDRDNLKSLFTEIGFTVKVFNDATSKKMDEVMQQVGKTDHRDQDCFACAILSHGEEGLVYGTDGPIQIEKLVAPLKGHQCQTLAGKPKLFFIQACRGTQLDEGVEVADAKGKDEMEFDSGEVEIRRIPTEADFLMAYSVVPGFYAWRNSTRGSWFIQALVDVLRENWKRMDLLSMMTRVCKKVAYDFESNASKEFMNRKKQIPCITSMLTREVIFTPKQ